MKDLETKGDLETGYYLGKAIDLETGRDIEALSYLETERENLETAILSDI